MTNYSQLDTHLQTPDAEWQREQCALISWAPNKKLLKTIRDYQVRTSKKQFAIPVIGILLRIITVVRHRFWSVVSGADIPLNSNLGGGLLIPHSNGVVIHPEAQIGVNCLIMSQVVIGNKNSKGPPKIGAHVDIGSGAKILGDISIGDYAKIGANAVVLENVPSGATAVGVPATIILSKP